MTYEEAMEILIGRKQHYEMQEEALFIAEAMGVAIDCIKKQMPKKPTYTGEKNIYGGIVRICNECDDKVCISPMAKAYENYCRCCGKRLVGWNEVE